MEIGDVVVSLKGHDTGEAFVVTSVVNDQFVLIADGKSRTLDNPKLKRNRHLRVVGKADLTSPTNATLKNSVKQYKERREYAEK